MSGLLTQCVPLATESGISLIILTRMKIFQLNLNRSTFVVWEMKKNVSVVCVCNAPNCCDTEQRSANQFPAWRTSLLISPSSDTRWSLVIWLRVPTQYGCCSCVLAYVWVHTGEFENILFSGKTIKELPGSVASGTHCIWSIVCLYTCFCNYFKLPNNDPNRTETCRKLIIENKGLLPNYRAFCWFHFCDYMQCYKTETRVILTYVRF